MPRRERGSAQRDDRGFTKLSLSAQCLKNERLKQWAIEIWRGILSGMEYKISTHTMLEMCVNAKVAQIQIQ